MDLHKRTIAKTITWRVIAVIITVLGVYAFNSSWGLALSSGISINVVKTVLYYIHERVWIKIKWQYIKKHETHLRTFIKTVSWKIITTIVTTVIIYFYIYDWKISLLSGFSINLVKSIFYYIHERIWNQTKYGKKH